jgi:hypothetical protein
MLIAGGLNRGTLSHGLIVAFSIDLLVRARSLVNKVGSIGSPIQHYLHLTNAVIVTLLGIDIAIQRLATYIGGCVSHGSPAGRLSEWDQYPGTILPKGYFTVAHNPIDWLRKLIT